MPEQVSRRTVMRSAALAAGGAVALPVLSACDDAGLGAGPSTGTPASGQGKATEPTRDPAELAALRAATGHLLLLSARYVAVLKRHPALRTRLTGPRALHDAHLSRLRGLGGGTAVPKSTPRAVPPVAAKAVAELIATEQRLAVAHATAAAERSGQAARVLASIAASQAQIAIALGRKAASG